MQTVAVLGASPKEDRYSNQAVKLLLEYAHQVLPVHPTCAEIHGQTCYKNLDAIDRPIDTLTLYVGPARSAPLIDTMLRLQPKRIIMNPGTESEELEHRAQDAGIEVVRGCTLVMLKTRQF